MKKKIVRVLAIFSIFCVIVPSLTYFIGFRKNNIIDHGEYAISSFDRLYHVDFPNYSDHRVIKINFTSELPRVMYVFNETELSNFLQNRSFSAYFENIDENQIYINLELPQTKGEDCKINIIILELNNDDNIPYFISIEQSYLRYYVNYGILSLILGLGVSGYLMYSKRISH